ncbi:hypothetical protein Cyan10605_2410 [Cyanobacterium aponinum PCC 10605]|uniref:Uncharacterized protein n=1 Tax=Cyanobacterium aponinum (strain PCC 10605) TaxID=755178 RepID=K9Z6X1_CYAAP|nr:hypothetical protein Cyan10605_2410 [Cyanobacterium aponinum PCC 10605]
MLNQIINTDKKIVYMYVKILLVSILNNYIDKIT